MEAPTTQRVPSADDGKARETVSSYVKRIQSGDLKSAAAFVTVAEQNRLPKTLSDWTSGAYAPLKESTGWTYTPSEFTSKGKALLLHAGFGDHSDGHYHTNVTLVQSGGKWMIDSIYPPSKSSPPVTSSASASHT